MNKRIINNLLRQINETIVEIGKKQETIKHLNSINKEKKIRNENKFNEISKELKTKETKIKTLMDNKYFSYIQFVDFINDNNLKELNGFEINKTGTLVEHFTKRTPNYFYEKNVNINKTEIVYLFNSDVIYNELEYSFYNLNGVPIIPEKITIFYEEFEENFYEDFFRFYNRFISNSFINNFLFTPKNIKKIKFVFNDTVDTSNDLCILYTNEYQNTDNNHNTILSFSNPYSLSTFNIFKNSHEDIPIKLSFTEDNLDYEQISFSNSEAIINLKNNGPFSIKIESDYKNFKVREVTINDISVMSLSSLTSNDATNTSYQLNVAGNINDCNIILPFSAYTHLETKMKDLGLDIKTFVDEKDDLYYINKNFIKFIKEDIPEIKKMKFYDDEAILKKANTYFNIYINTNLNVLYIPAFFNNYKVSLEINFQTSKQQIDSKYYTPMIFDISLKG